MQVQKGKFSACPVLYCEIRFGERANVILAFGLSAL
jgi:hypothetical protein